MWFFTEDAHLRSFGTCVFLAEFGRNDPGGDSSSYAPRIGDVDPSIVFLLASGTLSL